MPAIRNVASLHRGIVEQFVDINSDRYCTPCKTPPRQARASVDPKTPKKKKTSNAFFLYRSHVLANNLLPADITHQNDASRVAAQMWKAESHETRSHFFTLAEMERKKQRELDLQREFEMSILPTPVLSPSSTSSARSTFPSPPRTPDSPCLRIPLAPKIRTRELPSSPSLVVSPPFAPVFQPEVPPPNYDEPLIYTLSDEWSSPEPTSSLSFSPDFSYNDVPRKGGNALGLSCMGVRPINTFLSAPSYAQYERY